MEQRYQNVYIQMPVELHREVRAQATAEDMSMKDWVSVACRLLLRISNKSRREISSQLLLGDEAEASPKVQSDAR